MKRIALLLALSGWIASAPAESLPVSDLALLSVQMSPSQLQAGLAPSKLSLVITNQGPDDLIDAVTNLLFSYSFTRTTNAPFFGGIIGLTPITIAFSHIRIPADSSVELDFDPPALSDLAIPPDYSGTGLMVIRVAINPAYGIDPDSFNDAFVVEPHLIVTPAVPAERFIHLTRDDYSPTATNSLPFHQNLHLLDSSDFAFNHDYGNSWRLTRTGGFFRCSFESESDLDLALWVRHLASYAANAKNNGESAITILLNGEPVTQRFKIAQAHCGTHDYVNDSWAIRARPGTNILEWRADNLHTHYWIQSIMIGDPFRLALTRAEPDRFTLRLSGTLPFPATLDATPSIKEGWIPFHHLQPADLTPGGMSLTVTNLLPAQFFRLRADPALTPVN